MILSECKHYFEENRQARWRLFLFVSKHDTSLSLVGKHLCAVCFYWILFFHLCHCWWLISLSGFVLCPCAPVDDAEIGHTQNTAGPCSGSASSKSPSKFPDIPEGWAIFFFFFCSVTARPYTHQKWGSEQNQKVSVTRVPLAMKLLIAHFLKIVCENIGRQSSGIFRRLRGKRCLGRVGSEAGGCLYYKALKRLNVWPEIIKPNENWLFWYRGLAGE